MKKLVQYLKNYFLEVIDVFKPKSLLQSIKYTLIYMDKINVLIVFTLCFFGFIMIFSASSNIHLFSSEHFKNYFFVKKQIQWLILSIIVFFIIISVPYYKIKLFIVPLMGLNIISLVGLFFFGSPFNNATSWYDLRFMSLQPSEFVKIGIIVVLAWFFDRYQVTGTKFSFNLFFNIKKLPFSILSPIMYLGLICGLIFIQPDLGSAMIIFVIGMMIIIASGISIKDLSKMFLLAMGIIGPSMYLVLSKASFILGYQLHRITTWLHPFSDPNGAGYQPINGFVAIALGGLKGVGIGESLQKLGYIPEPYNDFIATIIAEELGLIGILIVLILYLYLAYRCVNLAINSYSIYGSLIAIGVGSMIFFQAFINLGGVSGLIPLTGVTLPFISYGGSSLMSMMIGFALLQSVSAHYNLIDHYNILDK